MKKLLFSLLVGTHLCAMVSEPGDHGKPILLSIVKKIFSSFGCFSIEKSTDVCPKAFLVQPVSSRMVPAYHSMPSSSRGEDCIEKGLKKYGNNEIPFHVDSTQDEIIIFFCKENITE